MIGKGATPSFFAIANYNYTLTIYTIADAKTMNECWQGFHALDVEMAIENLKEIYAQKQAMNI